MGKKRPFSDDVFEYDSQDDKPRRGRPPKNPKKDKNADKAEQKAGTRKRAKLGEESFAIQQTRYAMFEANLAFKFSPESVDRVCGRRPSESSEDGWEYAIKYKGLSYIHLVWMTRQELTDLDIKKNVIMYRNIRKLEDLPEEEQDQTLLYSPDVTKVDMVLDCLDVIIEVNESKFIPGWRVLPPYEELDPKMKIYNLPAVWTDRLGEENTKNSKTKIRVNELTGENPYLYFKKDISIFYPKNEAHPVPNKEGSIFRYERIYLVKWIDLAIAEATWERACDIQDDDKIQQFVEYNTVPERLLKLYRSYLPENYIAVTHDNMSYDSQVISESSSTRRGNAEDGKEPRTRGRPPKKIVQEGFRNRDRLLRLCIDTTPPTFPRDLAEMKRYGYKPAMPRLWRCVLNILMVFSDCSQTDLASFCGFAQSALSLYVNGKYTADPNVLLRKLKKWIGQTYPELLEIITKHTKPDEFQKACIPYVKEYIQKHPELGLTENHAYIMFGVDENGQKTTRTGSRRPTHPGKEVSMKKLAVDPSGNNSDPSSTSSNDYNANPKPSNKVYKTEYDWDTDIDYVKDFGPIGTCYLEPEKEAIAENQDRTVIFQNLDQKVLPPPPLREDADQKEKMKRLTVLPPFIAAPLEDSVNLVYTQPVSLEEVENTHKSGEDVSVMLNDVMKTVVYEDRTLSPEGYQVRNCLVGVVNNTADKYNLLQSKASLFKRNCRAEVLAESVLADVRTILAPLNTKSEFMFTPGIELSSANVEEKEEMEVEGEEEKVVEAEGEEEEEKVEKGEEEEKVEEGEDDDEKVKVEENEQEGADNEMKVEMDPESPAVDISSALPEDAQNAENQQADEQIRVAYSPKSVTYNRNRFKAFQQRMKMSAITVGDLLQMLFKPSELNPPITTLPQPPAVPLNQNFTRYEESPVFCQGRQLRDYQVVSLNWMIEKWRGGEGMILGDEMGLGKTIQVISLLNHFVTQEHQEGPFLVISPLSTLKNWYREFSLWTNMRVCFYHSEGKGKDERHLIRKYNWFFKGLPAKNLFKFNVLLTTYEVIMKDWSVIGNIDWKGIVMDEAHRMRNINCKFIQFINGIKAEHKLLLTGTPLQNNTGELWPLLNFLNIAEAGSLQRFREEFGDLHTSEQVEKLRALLAKCMLRRVKEDVEKSIPRKQETIVEVELTITQKQYYKAIYDRNRSFLYKGCKRSDIPSLMHVETQLRKVCNHPFLIRGVREKEEALVEEATRGETADTPSEMLEDTLDQLARQQRVSNVPSIVSCSGKMVLLDKLLPKLQSEGHRVLIFSQFVIMLDILQEYCQLRDYKVARIDGQTKGTERQEAIDAFSRPDSDYFIFLLSTRAGGLGINLTAADTVIIYDSDWNPQNDSQATARCHRIGQKQEVTVYRLLTRHTYEYEMFERASRKLAIESVVLDREKLNAQQAAVMDAEVGVEESEKMEEQPPSDSRVEPLVEMPEEVPEEGNDELKETPVETPVETPIEMEEEEKEKLTDLPESDDNQEQIVMTDKSTKKSKRTRRKRFVGLDDDESDDQLSEDGEFIMDEEEEDFDDDDEDLDVDGDFDDVVEEDEEDEDNLSTTTKSTQRSEKFVDNEYGVPAVPVMPVKKKRGRKPTKPRTLEDELNPYKRTKNEVEEMLRRGLFDCIMDSSATTSMEFFEADISTILEKNTRAEGTVGVNGHQPTPTNTSVKGIERGGTIYSKRSFTPESASAHIDINDPDFWEKMLDHPNADMLLQRLQDANVMRDPRSVNQWLKDLEGLVKELCTILETEGESDFNQHEVDTTNNILVKASVMATVFGKRACGLMVKWMEDLQQSRFRKRTIRKTEEPLAVPPKPAEPTVNYSICCICMTGELDEPGCLLVTCAGRCHRQFHPRCVGHTQLKAKWKCQECTSRTHTCMICGVAGKEGDSVMPGRKRDFSFYEQWLRYNDIELYISTFGMGNVTDFDRDRYKCAEPVLKCTQYHCDCFYHMSCARKAESFTFYNDQHPCFFRCPRHYCTQCKNSHISQMMVICPRCPRAYHLNCIKKIPHRSINRKYFLCENHPNEEPHPPRLPEGKKKKKEKKKDTVETVAVPTRSSKRLHKKLQDQQSQQSQQSQQNVKEEVVLGGEAKEEMEVKTEVKTEVKMEERNEMEMNAAEMPNENNLPMQEAVEDDQDVEL